MIIGERHRLHLITYDIREDKTRTKLMKMLKGYGQRVQYSCFEVWIGPSVFKTLKKKIEKLIDLDEDSVRYYIICDKCAKKMQKSGTGEVTRDEQQLFSIWLHHVNYTEKCRVCGDNCFNYNSLHYGIKVADWRNLSRFGEIRLIYCIFMLLPKRGSATIFFSSLAPISTRGLQGFAGFAAGSVFSVSLAAAAAAWERVLLQSSPDFEGIETDIKYCSSVQSWLQSSPDFEGIETVWQSSPPKRARVTEQPRFRGDWDSDAVFGVGGVEVLQSSPDFEGIETVWRWLAPTRILVTEQPRFRGDWDPAKVPEGFIGELQSSPDFEGIETPVASVDGSYLLLQSSPDFEGIETTCS